MVVEVSQAFASDFTILVARMPPATLLLSSFNAAPLPTVALLVCAVMIAVSDATTETDPWVATSEELMA